MTTDAKTVFVNVISFEGIEDLVHPPRTWVVDDINGRKLVIQTIEDDITGDLMISNVWDHKTVRTDQALLNDKAFRKGALSAIEAKVRGMNLALLNHLVAVLIKEDRDGRGEEGYATLLHRFVKPDDQAGYDEFYAQTREPF